MEKHVLRITLALVIIILVSVYAFNSCSLEEPAAWDYNVVAGKAYTSKMDVVANKDPQHVTNDIYFSINKGEELIVLERKYNYAKVSKEINDEVVYGYIDAYYLSSDASSINYIEPKLGMIEDCDVYYTPSSAYEDKYPNKFTGLVKVTATNGDYSLIKLADYSLDNDELMWVKNDDLSTYNSLKIDVGTVNESCKMYVDEKLEERASESLRNKILEQDFVKITATFDEYVKVTTKDGDSVVISQSDFEPIKSASQIK